MLVRGGASVIYSPKPERIRMKSGIQMSWPYVKFTRHVPNAALHAALYDTGTRRHLCTDVMLYGVARCESK